VQQGNHPISGSDPTKIGISVEVLRKMIDERSKEAAGYAAWQFNFLIGGATLFVAWHVLEMYLRARPS